MAEVFVPDNLVAGSNFPLVRGALVVASGTGVAERGMVLGLRPDGKAVPVLCGATDGSDRVYAVLADSVDATAADATATGYFTGEFAESQLRFGGTDTADMHRVSARYAGIFFCKTVAA